MSDYKPTSVSIGGCASASNNCAKFNQNYLNTIYNKVANYQPKYMCNAKQRPICVQKRPYNQPPMVVNSKKQCKRVPQNRCNVNKLAIGRNSSPLVQVMGSKPFELSFENLLAEHALYIILLAEQVEDGQKKMIDSTEKELYDNADKWLCLLGPTWVEILKCVLKSLIKIAKARLGPGSVEERQKLLDDAMEELQCTRRSLGLFFRAMPTLCNAPKMACCIESLWDNHVDKAIAVFEAMEEQSKDSDAYNQASAIFEQEADNFGEYLDALRARGILRAVAACKSD